VSYTLPTKLAAFDGSKETTFKWADTNHPVMGGASTSSFQVDEQNKIGVFNGTCRVVPKLNAPGFAKIQTGLELKGFKDVAEFIDGSFQIHARTSTPDYKGYKAAFSAKGVPSHAGGHEYEGSFKTEFSFTGTEFQTLKVPFNWSDFTGRCDTKDPTGTQHHCCSGGAKYCPTAAYLKEITGLQIWSEGVAGDFHLEIDWIGAGKE
jgi:hypothetical protein